MLKNIDHLPYYDYITNSTVAMNIDNSNYPLINGNPGAAVIASDTFTTGR
jgi:hypothetical protein